MLKRFIEKYVDDHVYYYAWYAKIYKKWAVEADDADDIGDERLRNYYMSVYNYLLDEMAYYLGSMNYTKLKQRKNKFVIEVVKQIEEYLES